MSNLKIPRENTRARAVYDKLVEAYHDDRLLSWTEAKDAYDNKDPAYPTKAEKSLTPRNWSQMEVARLLQKYASRIERGRYSLKTKYIPEPEHVPEVANQFQPGDWVRVKGTMYPDDPPTYQVESSNGDSITLSGHYGYHKASRFALVVKGPISQVKPKVYSGSPEIADMPWRSSSEPATRTRSEEIDDINRIVALEADVARLKEENKHLRDVVDYVKEMLNTTLRGINI